MLPSNTISTIWQSAFYNFQGSRKDFISTPLRNKERRKKERRKGNEGSAGGKKKEKNKTTSSSYIHRGLLERSVPSAPMRQEKGSSVGRFLRDTPGRASPAHSRLWGLFRRPIKLSKSQWSWEKQQQVSQTDTK